MEWFGEGSVFVELQRNFLQGDAELVQESVTLARGLGCYPSSPPTTSITTSAERYRLQHALVAARLNTTMERALPHIRPNHHLHLKSPDQMVNLFEDLPQKPCTNTLKIAEQCEFDLATGLGYTLPDPAVPCRLHCRKLPETSLLRGRTAALRDRDTGGQDTSG